MPTPDTYGQGVQVYALSDRPDLEKLARDLADGIIPRTLMRFADAAARNATLTSPVAGMQAWLADQKIYTYYTGAAWVRMSALLMDWTALSSLGSYASGWSAGTPAPRMRKIIDMGTEVWELEGRLVKSSPIAANTTTTMFTFGASHRVASTRGVVKYNSSHHGARVSFANSGVLSVSVPSEAGPNVTDIWLDDTRITNPAA